MEAHCLGQGGGKGEGEVELLVNAELCYTAPHLVWVLLWENTEMKPSCRYLWELGSVVGTPPGRREFLQMMAWSEEKLLQPL